MRVILAPYPQKLRNGKVSAKQFPWWSKVVARLNELGHEVIQIGAQGENRIDGVSEFIVNWPLEKLRDIIDRADTWLSCDSFLPHYCHTHNLRSGVVVWSVSDHRIWGHDENTNILKSREYLRQFQYQSWEECEYNEAAFVLPQVVVDAVLNHVASQSTQSTNRTTAIPSSVQLAQQETVEATT